MDRSTPAARDALIACAIDRVLDAEQANRTQVADCESRSRDLLEQARQQRRALMERARARIVSLHARVAHAIEAQDARQREEGQRTADQSSVRLENHDHFESALEKLAGRLTNSDE